MLDWRGQVAEATGANIFLVQKGVLHTPTPDCFLDGITRRTVMGLARKRGYEIVERAIMPEEFAHTDEVFLTGTAVEVTPVRSIDRITVGGARSTTTESMSARSPAPWSATTTRWSTGATTWPQPPGRARPERYSAAGRLWIFPSG